MSGHQMVDGEMTVDNDRILVRINTQHGEEMRLWFTRRLVLGLWPSLSRAVAHAAEFATDAAATAPPVADRNVLLVNSLSTVTLPRVNLITAVKSRAPITARRRYQCFATQYVLLVTIRQSIARWLETK
jgi:hypothetical protein